MQHTKFKSAHAPFPAMAFNLAALALILLMAGLGIAYWLNGFASTRTQITSSVYAAPIVTKTLANTNMQIPQIWLNILTQSTQKDVQAVDLTLKISVADQEQSIPINLRISEASQAEPSAYLLDSVYVLRFSKTQIGGFKGLVGKPLKAQDGYESETVWYEPISDNPFVAKCIDFEGSKSALNCLRTIRLNSQLSATYQFAQSELEYWRQLDGAIIPLMRQIGISLE
ncbi:hypothetical protein MNBD_ALPHA11-743 [hydrothermal vent metagenome]|uniref:Uncharacterized protein n=1 Tax=hydrothermal vent metagenome TaxID=652676 RepID=A0A3B0UPR0_9ZZZZ